MSILAMRRSDPQNQLAIHNWRSFGFIESLAGEIKPA